MIDALDSVLRQLRAAPNEARVSTTTLLPSGALATVRVRPQCDGRFFVTDDRSGLEEAGAFGLELDARDAARGNRIAERAGLSFDDHQFSLRDVGPDQLASVIVYVADAAREWAEGAAERGASRTGTGLRRALEDRLQRIFGPQTIGRETELHGDSGRSYKFDFVVSLKDERKALFEIVQPHPNALSAAHLKLFDLKAAQPDWPREAVTERLDVWSAADMVLLAGVTTHVRDLRHDWRDLERLAA